MESQNGYRIFRLTLMEELGEKATTILYYETLFKSFGEIQLSLKKNPW